MFEILVVFLSSLSGVDPLKASQVFGLVSLHLLHRGCLTLTQLLRSGGETHTSSPLHVRTGCVFDLGSHTPFAADQTLPGLSATVLL